MLARRIRALKDTRPVLEAMGAEAVSLTKRSFTDAALRPATWPAKRDGSAATLRKSGAMWQSIRITEVTGKSVAWGSDRVYAAIHQLGGKTGKGGKVTMPARPFFPVLNKKITEAARKRIDAVGARKIESIMGK